MTINWLLILLIYIIKQDNVKPFISFDIPVFYEILQAVYNFIQEKKAPGYFTLQSNACQNNTCLTSDLLTLWPFVKVPIMPNILCACKLLSPQNIYRLRWKMLQCLFPERFQQVYKRCPCHGYLKSWFFTMNSSRE